jgi:hypothetical protein
MAFSPDFHLKHWLPLRSVALSITIGYGFILTQAEPAFAQEFNSLTSDNHQLNSDYSSVDEDSAIFNEESTSIESTDNRLLAERNQVSIDNSLINNNNVSTDDESSQETLITPEDFQSANRISTEADVSAEEKTDLARSGSISVDWKIDEEQQSGTAAIAAPTPRSDIEGTNEVAQVFTPVSLPPPPLQNYNSATAPPLPNAVSSSPGTPVQWTVPVPTQSYSQAMPAQVPSGAGTWVMVWIPYGVPTAPAVPPIGGTASMPVTTVPSGYYPGWMPYTTPPGVPAPNGVVSNTVPWSAASLPTGQTYPVALPQQQVVFQPAPPQGYWAVSPGYGYSQPVMPLPTGQTAYPSTFYNAPATVPTGDIPLPVPVAPSGSTNIPTLPAPPSVAPTIPVNPYPGVSPAYSPITPVSLTPAPVSSQTVPPSSTTATNLAVDIPREPITGPDLDLQGLYILQGDNSSARARVSGSAFLTPNLLVGGVLDVVTGPDLTNDDGLQLTELYLAASIPGVPGLRLRFGQLDLTSYFDRNSFAKDASRDFFNSTFQTNPALIAGANVTASRPAGLVQWSITDDIAFSGAVFSSDADIGEFALNGFAGEASFRAGDLIVRGTFISSEDSEFQGTGDRLESYGVNAEWFIPNLNIGLFGRYGHLENTESDLEADTYSFGLNALDVFMDDDRLGVGYGRNLEVNEGDDNPDVLEIFYDFELLPNIRTGFTLQPRNSFSETYSGFRIRTDIDLTPSVFAD